MSEPKVEITVVMGSGAVSAWQDSDELAKRIADCEGAINTYTFTTKADADEALRLLDEYDGWNGFVCTKIGETKA